MIVLALVLAALALLASALLDRRVRKALRPVWIWHSGAALDGQRHTNATWLRPSHGSRPVLHPTGHAIRWHHLPRLHRAAIRTGGTFAALATATGLIFATVATVATLAILTLTCLAWLAWRAVRWLANWKHWRAWGRPLHRALAVKMGAPPAKLEIARDRSKVVVGLPEEFTPSDRDKDEITRAVTTKLAIESPVVDWSKLHGAKPLVVFTPCAEPPPLKVALSDIQAAIKAAKPHEVVVGIGQKGAIGKISIDNDSPHIGLSMGSGEGKSTVAKNMAAQLAYHGALLMILDYKRISHTWARGLPNVSYANTPARIHDALLWLAAEVGRRNEVAEASADIEGNVTGTVGPRIFVIAEELNALQGQLAKHWRLMREEAREMGIKDMPKRSPASEALDEVLFVGRQVLVNVLEIGQRLSVKATSGAGGGGDARENLGVLVFRNPGLSTWKMLRPDLPLPPADEHVGRILVVTGKTIRRIQSTWMTGQEACDFATSGTVAIPHHDMPFIAAGTSVSGVPVLGADTGPAAPDLGKGVIATLRKPPPAPVRDAQKLSAIVDLIPGMTLDGLRKASLRWDDFPEPIGRDGPANTYDPDEVLECVQSHRQERQSA